MYIGHDHAPGGNKLSQKGFDVVISVFCSSDSEHKKITDLLNVSEIPF